MFGQVRRRHEKRVHGTSDQDCQHSGSQPGKGPSPQPNKWPHHRYMWHWGKEATAGAFSHHSNVILGTDHMCLNVELPEDYRGRWETFVEQTLSETNKKNTIDLVNRHRLTSVVFSSCLVIIHELKHGQHLWCGCFHAQVGTGNPLPCSEDDMESPFPKELTVQQVKMSTSNIQGSVLSWILTALVLCFRPFQTIRSSRWLLTLWISLALMMRSLLIGMTALGK